MTIDEYLDAALAAKKLPSDRQLGFALGLGGTMVCQYRTKRAWPDDATMIRIAEGLIQKTLIPKFLSA